MPDGRLSCTACDYRGFMVFRRITLAYHFADGTTVDAPRDIRWCSDCGNPRDTESSQPALEALQAELDALKASSAIPGYRVKRWFARLFGLGADDLQKRADELRGQIRLGGINNQVQHPTGKVPRWASTTNNSRLKNERRS